MIISYPEETSEENKTSVRLENLRSWHAICEKRKKKDCFL